MKKIALCFSGQLRCHKKLIIFWKEYFINQLVNNNYLPIIFFNTSDECNDLEIEEIKKEYDGIVVFFKKEIDLDYKEIKPKIFNLIPSGLERNGHNQLLREFNHMDSVIKMKKNYEIENNLVFDFVFRTRPDVFPNKNFDINFLIDVHENFFISNHDHHGGINARFTLSKSNISDYIYTIINDCENVIVKSNLFSGEQFWEYHLVYKKIEIKKLNYNLFLMRDYDKKLPTHEHGNISLNGKILYRFKKDKVITLNDFKP